MGEGWGGRASPQSKGGRGGRGIIQICPHDRWTDSWSRSCVGAGAVHSLTAIPEKGPGPGSWDMAALGLEPGSLGTPKPMQLCGWFIAQL